MASFWDLLNIPKSLNAGASWIYNFFESPARNQQINEYLALHPMEARVKDLEAAGLSPTLATGMSASAPMHMTNTSGASNPISALATLFQMRQAKASVDKMHVDMQNSKALTNANVDKMLAEAKVADSLAHKYDVDSQLTAIQSEDTKALNTARIAQLTAQAGLTDAAKDKIPAEIRELNTRADVHISDVGANNSRIKLQDAQTGKVLVDSLLSNETVAKIRAETEHIIKSDAVLDAQVSKLNVEEKELLYNLLVAMYARVKTNDPVDKDFWSYWGANRMQKWISHDADDNTPGGNAFDRLYRAVRALIRNNTEY